MLNVKQNVLRALNPKGNALRLLNSCVHVHLFIMLKGSLKVLIAIVLSLMFTISLVKIVLLIWSSYPDWLHHYTRHEHPSSFTADEWLAYKRLFRDKGKSIRCASRCIVYNCPILSLGSKSVQIKNIAYTSLCQCVFTDSCCIHMHTCMQLLGVCALRILAHC